jgi:hypothetical protein
MPLLDSALAFAITMLALSLTCSAIVELIHRLLKMRQAGFKYMLDQMFDQVLSKYVEPAIKDGTLKGTLEDVKKAFVERMRANRAPMGAEPYAKLAGSTTVVPENSRGLRVWGGRELTELSPVGFMERLGTMDIGTTVASAADDLDAALKDIAQKFEAIGKDAADYFEGRARLISVAVAVVFAIAVHADAVDLYTTYLQNPNATAAVIAKSQAIAAQFETAQKAAKAADDAKKPADGKKHPEAVAHDDGKKQFEDAQKAAAEAKAGAEKMVKQFADLGVPLGWTDQRLEAADMLVLLWSCKKLEYPKSHPWLTVWRTCKLGDEETGTTAKDGNTNLAPAKGGNKGTPATATAAKGDTTANASKEATELQYTNVWFGIPMNLGVLFYLVLGGLLIGLGAPFWYNVVTTVTNIRGGGGGGGGAGGAGGATGSAAQAPGGVALRAAAPAEAEKAQPATPAGAFQVAQAAKK